MDRPASMPYAPMAPGSPTPKALRHAAQGCEARATLGLRAESGQPQRGCVTPRADDDGRNPVGVDGMGGTIPRVAPQTAQPWAVRRNPLGIQGHARQGGRP